MDPILYLEGHHHRNQVSYLLFLLQVLTFNGVSQMILRFTTGKLFGV